MGDNPVSGFLQAIADACVHVVATASATILNHPTMQEAAAGAIVFGLNCFVTQPQLGQQLHIMADTLSTDQNEVARKAGKDFPKIVSEFIKGVFEEAKESGEELKTELQEEHSNHMSALQGHNYGNGSNTSRLAVRQVETGALLFENGYYEPSETGVDPSMKCWDPCAVS